MEIDPHCQRQNCSPLNVLFIDVQISLILLGVALPGVYNYNTLGENGMLSRRAFVSDSWAFLLVCLSAQIAKD